MQRSLYNLIIQLIQYTSFIWKQINPKTKQFIEGRRDLLSKVKQSGIDSNSKLIWIHCSSLGEFEQGRPIIESLKKDFSYKILLTFFSPSGYTIRKDYPYADYIFYLPLDTPKNVEQFISLVNPSLLILVKYDLWYNLLRTLQTKNIPIILISAIFNRGQFYFKWYGQFFLPLLKKIDKIFLQETDSTTFLLEKGFTNLEASGDSRIDRVFQIAQQAKSFPIIEKFSQNQATLICGSTWEKDELILESFIHNDKYKQWKIIIAPHDISEKNVLRLVKLLKRKNIRYSKASLENIEDTNVLIIDNIGMLSSIYQYGKVAYIGGGFGKGIHNTLEPIAFGLPVIFGPRYNKFREACYLVESQGGFSVQNKLDFMSTMDKLSDSPFYQKCSKNAKRYVEINLGATRQIVSYIHKDIFKG